MHEILIGAVIGGVGISLIWLIWLLINRRHVDGKLTMDLTGEGEPVHLDISQFDTMLTAKQVVLAFELKLPEEQKDVTNDG